MRDHGQNAGETNARQQVVDRLANGGLCWALGRDELRVEMKREGDGNLDVIEEERRERGPTRRTICMRSSGSVFGSLFEGSIL